MTIQLNPLGSLDLLSQYEVQSLKAHANSDLFRIFRNCCLAVLNVGSVTDSAAEIYEQFQDFEVNLVARERGIRIELINPPENAFVDGQIIRGIHEHLFAVLRDILFTHSLLEAVPAHLAESPAKRRTHQVFDLLRNAHILRPGTDPGVIVCWGGHSINSTEYDYTKKVGYELGLRGLDICTGCGPGAMKGPMKGATIGHNKQRIRNGRYLGLTEPGIIASEPPNPIVNELVILPDIEKRLEAFMRVAHGIIIFPGGPGTAEELLYLLGILMSDSTAEQILPVILTGPRESEHYFIELEQFLVATLGPEVLNRVQIIIDDPVKVAQLMKQGCADLRHYRKSVGDAYYFNWTLDIPEGFQHPFHASHDTMAALQIRQSLPKAELAANLRRAFSGIVCGNVKEEGIRAIREHGPFLLSGDPDCMASMDRLLEFFVQQGRMKLPGSHYEPCYRIVSA